MAFDSFALTAALNQLQQIGMDARIGKIHQPDKHTILLRFHGPMGAGRLLISAHPEQGRLQLTEIARENPAQAPLFTMVLRKWLDGAKITRIEQTPGERVAIITLLTRNDIGDPITCKLISEIMGKHSNIILVNECDVIIDGIHRYNSNLSRYRQVLPGQPYIPPPPMHKLPLDQVDEENLGLLLFQQAELTVRELLLQQVGGLSPLFAASCCYQSNITPTTLCGELGLAEIRRLCQHLNDLANAAAAANFHPTLLLKAGKPEDFAAFLPGEWENLPHRSIADISQAIDTLYLSKEQERLFNLKQRELKKLFQHHITRLNKKISLQEEDLRQSEAADRYKQAGDLLSAYQYDLRKGVSEAELPIFDDPHQTIKIKLNPALTPQENISRYYHRYSKAKNARSTIEEHLEANRQELNYVLSLQNALNCAETMAELQDIVKESISEGLLRPPAPVGKNNKTAKDKNHEAPLPPRAYLSADGFSILVGRNNKQNDKLTLKTANENDIWLHAQKIPGSHVIIQSRGETIPESTLLTAAAAAAWFSDGRNADKTPVDYTLAKEVKKPAQARPGMVIYFKQKTFYVKPEEPPIKKNL